MCIFFSVQKLQFRSISTISTITQLKPSGVWEVLLCPRGCGARARLTPSRCTGIRTTKSNTQGRQLKWSCRNRTSRWAGPPKNGVTLFRAQKFRVQGMPPGYGTYFLWRSWMWVCTIPIGYWLFLWVWALALSISKSLSLFRPKDFIPSFDVNE